MVKLTIVGRVRDGLPIAQGPRYANEENGSFSIYKQQGEFILKEISTGALLHSKMTILVDHHCFNFVVEDGFCFITLLDSSYPRILAFHYLEDLQKEFQQFDKNILDTITRPYCFVKFDGIIGKIKKQYIDTRTQTNLSKLNANCGQDLHIVSEHIFDIVQRNQNSELHETRPTNPTVSSIWRSNQLQVIAVKWIPITIVVVVTAVVIWASLNLKDPFEIPNY